MPLWGQSNPTSPPADRAGVPLSRRASDTTTFAAAGATAGSGHAAASLQARRMPSGSLQNNAVSRGIPSRTYSADHSHTTRRASTASTSSRISSTRPGLTRSATGGADDDDETWDEASDDELPADVLAARLGGISLRDPKAAGHRTAVSAVSKRRESAGTSPAPDTTAKGAQRRPISPIQTGAAGGAPKSATSPASTSSPAGGRNLDSLNSSMRPGPRPTHTSSSSSIFGGLASAASSASAAWSYFAASPPSTPSALYSYSRAPPQTGPSAAQPGDKSNSDRRPGSGGGAAAAVPSPSLGAEAVAAALSGRPGMHANPHGGTSYLAGASRVQEAADRVVQQEEKGAKLPAAGAAEGGVKSMPIKAEEGPCAEDQKTAEAEGDKVPAGSGDGEPDIKVKSKRAARSDAADIVKDPAHVLERLRVAWQPRPSSQPASRTHSDSFLPTAGEMSVPPSPQIPQRNGASGPYSDSDDEAGRAAGYVPLNASAISSHEANLVVELEPAPPDPEEEVERRRENRRKRKFLEVLADPENVDLAELRKLAWSGCPSELRPMVWQLLLGYLPAPVTRRLSTLARKRSEYASLVRQAFSRGVKGLDGPLWHQISIDVPRTKPGVPLWQAEATQRSLERILYVWAIRHPASGYVQGINDLVTPFFQVFLANYIDTDPEEFDVAVLAPEVLEALEADTFWCLSKLLDQIQDHYIIAQPGILRLVEKMQTYCSRVDAPLAAHLKEEGVEFIQFAFRWMNCLLMRELSVRNITRMWDTYLAEGGDAFSEFHLYVCLAFLVRWSDQLREMDFQSIIIFLQSLPTKDWTDKDTELLLSEAFMWSRTFVAR